MVAEVPQVAHAGKRSVLKKTFDLELSTGVSAGAALASASNERQMFRTTLLSIVVSLTLGQDLNLLCRTWCDAKGVAVSECHHNAPTATPQVAGTKDCANEGGAATAALKEDARNGASPRHATQAMPPPPCQLVRSTIDATPGHEPWRSLSLDRHPLSTALRI
jgi:hypothetical protein